MTRRRGRGRRHSRRGDTDRSVAAVEPTRVTRREPLRFDHLTLGVVALFALACESGPRAAPAGETADVAQSATPVPAPGPDPTHLLFGCLVGDSAVYAEVAAAGAAGVTIDLWQAGDGIDGSTRPTGGAPEQSLPVAGVRLTGADSVRLAMPTAAADTSVFEGRASCDSLWGVQRKPPSAAPRAARYRRVH